jgi:hypothetical protein
VRPAFPAAVTPLGCEPRGFEDLDRRDITLAINAAIPDRESNGHVIQAGTGSRLGDTIRVELKREADSAGKVQTKITAAKALLQIERPIR